MSPPRILDWRPLRKNSLLGFAKVELPSGMIVHDVTVLSGERGPWASPPSKPMIDRDGVALRVSSGGAVMSSETLSPAARQLLAKSRDDRPITFEEALAACPWQSILGRGRNAEEMIRRLAATVAVIDQERDPLSADMLADAVATLARGETVLLIAARRSDRDYAKQQILAMAAGDGGRA